MILLQSVVKEFPNLLNPEELIAYGGFWLVLLIVFAETGLLFGFFLPGDALLFAAGLLTASGTIDYSIEALLLGLNIADILGNMLAYSFGKKAGESLFTRDDSIIFKKRYVYMSKTFFDKYGGVALIIGRFLPIVRTFAPILAGVASIPYRIFMLYNIIGSIMWTVFMAGSGYYLVKIYPPLKDHIGLVTAGLILVTMGTVISTYIRERRKASN
ncbi:MAG: VTT domain-containing protein [Bacteroidetes bacterium]|nr:VTT domain-containing protein [Bacteroidota bacterium]